MNKCIKRNFFLFVTFSKSMNMFVNLRNKLVDSVIKRWLYLTIPVAYEVGVFLIIIFDGVLIDSNDEFFSYSRDISNSVVMSFLFLLSYYVSGYYYNKVISAMKYCVRDDDLKKELGLIENDTKECYSSKKIKKKHSAIQLLVFFICVVISASVMYFFVHTASQNSIEHYYWFDRMGGERVFYLILLGLTWYHSLRLLGMVLFSGFTFYHLLKEDLVKYDCNMNSRDANIKQITDVLISNFSYGLFYIIGTIMLIINDNVSAIQTNYRINNSFCDPLIGTITIAVMFFLVFLAYIPFQELISYMRKKREEKVGEIDKAIQEAHCWEGKQYFIDKKKTLLMEPIIQTTIGNRLTVFLSIIIPFVGVILQAIQLFM